MPRPKSLIPKLCIDKSRNRAFCKVDGKFVVLGRAGSADAQLAYGRVLKSLEENRDLAAVRHAAKPVESVPAEAKLSLNDLFLRFCTEELHKYQPAEQRCIRGAIRAARERYGETAAVEFGPLRLRAVRDAMVTKGWGRTYVNKEVKRLRMIMRWAVGWQLVPQTLADSLGAVKSLQPGDSEARESTPRHALCAEHIEAVRPHLTDRYRDMLDLMLLSGCRSGELIGLTTDMIDRSGEIWRVALARHKTTHKGKSRTLYFNPKAQLILSKYLKADPTAPLFRTRGDRFSAAVKDACLKVGVPEFTPHWLRHTVATRIADEMGTEAAQRLLGHATRAMTEHYSRAAERQAMEAVKRLG